MEEVRIRLSDGGRVVIPAEFLEALGLVEGEELIMRLANGEITMFSVEQAVRVAQRKVKKAVPNSRSLADELVAGRRAE